MGKLDKLKSGFVKLKKITPSTDKIVDVIDSNTLRDIKNGKFFITDSIINDAVAQRIATAKNSPITKFNLISKEDGCLEMTITNNDGMPFTFIGAIDDFVLEKGSAILVYNVKKHQLSDNKIISWLLSQVSLGIMHTLYSFLKNDIASENIEVTVTGNIITVNFSKLYAESAIGQASFKGVYILDLFSIVKAIPEKGGIGIYTKWNGTASAVGKLLSSRKEE